MYCDSFHVKIKLKCSIFPSNIKQSNTHLIIDHLLTFVVVWQNMNIWIYQLLFELITRWRSVYYFEVLHSHKRHSIRLVYFTLLMMICVWFCSQDQIFHLFFLCCFIFLWSIHDFMHLNQAISNCNLLKSIWWLDYSPHCVFPLTTLHNKLCGTWFVPHSLVRMNI